MHSFGIFSIFFIISCGYFRVYASAELNIVAPANLNRETELRDISTRSLFLHENQAREIANMLLAKNVSIFIEFSQELHNKGTLLAVYGNNSKVFELFSEGLKGELRASWRRGLRLANLNIQNIELDDNVWHKIIFDLHGGVMRLSVDCVITSVSGQYPEIDFGLLSRTRPTVWVGQRHLSQALLVGRIRHFKVKPDSFYFEECLKNNLNKLEVAAPMLNYMATNLGGLLNNKTNTTSSNDNVEDSALMEQLKQKLKRLEAEVSKWRPQQQNAQSGINGNVSNVTAKAAMSVQDEPDGSQGDCPNCYAYLRHKINYLEQEFKKWRETVQKVENNLKRVLLVQRGCSANNVYYGDGDRWQTDDCIECTCNLGKPMCKPIGCLPLTCPRPVKVVGQCCPVCKAECKYMDKTYHDGQTFWPKSCVRCQCRDGDTSCAHQDALKCPKLHCPKEQQATPPEECCPLCVNSSCQPNPCHADAVCQPFNFGVSCRCKAGFFGDGRACFDIDECQLRGGDANDRLTADGPCGSGARCINTNGGYHCECLPGYTKTANRTGCFDTIVPLLHD